MSSSCEKTDSDSPGEQGAEAQLTWAPLNCSAVLTHHWLVRRRGGENVLAALCRLVPGSPIYTFIHDAAGAGDGWPEVRTSFLQRLPGAKRHYPKLLPLMPAAARKMRLPAVDLVLCSDAALAKAMRPHADSLVVCYCHSPMRYVWDLAETYAAALPVVVRPLWRALVPRLRRVDRAAAERVDLFIANSRHVADRIQRHYGRESTVVHPPVELPERPASGTREDFYLCLGYHVTYKRLDLAVEACTTMGKRLIVIGDGPDVDRIRRCTPPGVSLLGWQPQAIVHDHLSRAAALIFPGEEDFGIVPVEAVAHGCPVIAYGVGGAAETVVPGETGVLFERQTVECLCGAMRRFEQLSFDPVRMHADVQRFDRERFMRRMHEILSRALNERVPVADEHK